MAGTALIHVTGGGPRAPRRPSGGTVVEDERGAGDEGGEQPDHLGVDVEERERVEAAVDTEAGGGGDGPGRWSSWRSSSRMSLGVPVVPDVERTSPPSAGRDVAADRPRSAAGLEGRRRDPGRSGPGRRRRAGRRSRREHDPVAGPGRAPVGRSARRPGAPGRRRRPAPASGAAGSSGAATRRPRRRRGRPWRSRAGRRRRCRLWRRRRCRGRREPAHRDDDRRSVAERHERPVGAGVLDVRCGRRRSASGTDEPIRSAEPVAGPAARARPRRTARG